jgi:3-methyladenine DNA glycosylase AlkD
MGRNVVTAIQRELAAVANPERAAFLKGFFKTGPGEYAEGDVFRGINVPVVRDVASRHFDLALGDVAGLLASRFHEDRALALIVLVRQFRRAPADHQRAIYELYLASTSRINNWDLVDVSAAPIVGGYLLDRSRRPLTKLAKSRLLWERRIAIIATMEFLPHGEVEESLRIAELLVADREDLIHKAVGWVLREVGKRDLAAEEAFLSRHCLEMPRTMLRYAIERFPEGRRREYLNGSAGGAE